MAGTAVLLVAVLAACGGPGSGSPRPTDPRQILTDAIHATAAVPTLRLHAELVATSGPLGANQPNAVTKGAFDADVDLALRQMAGRMTMTMPGGFGGANAAPQIQTVDAIVTRTGTFSRTNQAARWQKSGGGIEGGPTNAEVATLIANLLSNPAMTFDLRDAAPCTLGTCDHVIAHIDGPTLGTALGSLFGGGGGVGGAGIPSFEIDVLVDQSTSVISELRTSISSGGTAVQALVTVSNPGDPVQITAPLPGLVDDFTGGGFGGGGVVIGTEGVPVPTIGPEESTILEEVGGELATPTPEPASPTP